jgi:hypothetical protein
LSTTGGRSAKSRLAPGRRSTGHCDAAHPDGLRFQVVKGTPEGEEAKVLGAALDRVVAWDRSQESGP